MEQKDINWQSAGIGLVALGIIGWLAIALISTIEQAPWPALAAILTVLGSILTIGSNLEAQRRNEQKEHKVKIYEKITHFFFETIFAAKMEHNQKTEKEVTEFLVEVTPGLIMWGSDKVVESFMKFRSTGAIKNYDHQTNGLKLILYYEQMLLNIRKDLGHENKNLEQGSILKIFIDDLDEYSRAISELERIHQTQRLTEAQPSS